jgi:parallel beta-helix repeat protein
MKRIAHLALALLLLVAFTPLLNQDLGSNVSSVTASGSPRKWYVPLDFPNITSAIQSPEVSDGDTIEVLRSPNGTYKEGQIIVNKSLNITANKAYGEVIVDGMRKGHVFYILRNNVIIRGFTIINASEPKKPSPISPFLYLYGGIFVSSEHCLILENLIENNSYGILINTAGASHSVIHNNIIRSNIYGGILSYSPFWPQLPPPPPTMNVSIHGNIVKNNGFELTPSMIWWPWPSPEPLGGIEVSGNKFSIRGNIITGNVPYGLRILYLANSVVSNNSMSNNKFNLYIETEPKTAPTLLIDDMNTVDGGKVYYMYNLMNATLDPNSLKRAGYLAVINSIDVTIRNFNFTRNGQGIYLLNVTNVKVYNTTLSYCYKGIHLKHVKRGRLFNLTLTRNDIGASLYNVNETQIKESNFVGCNDLNIDATNSYNNTITGNTMVGWIEEVWLFWNRYLVRHPDNGINIIGGRNNRVFANYIKNSGSGIKLTETSNNEIFGNSIVQVDYGIRLYNSERNILLSNNIFPEKPVKRIWWMLITNLINDQTAILLEHSHENMISYNGLHVLPYGWGKWGTGMALKDSYYNVVYANIIYENRFGFNLTGSYDNIIYHNDFIRNTIQANTVNSAGNIWDSDALFGGNFWSDYNGTDANGDGIGDSPYVIDSYNVDRYPLMYPCNPHDVTIKQLTVQSDSVNSPVNINVTVENNGVWTESFTLTVSYARVYDPVIGSQKATLIPGQTATFNFTWTPMEKGGYEIKAYILPVPFEFNITNNYAVEPLRIPSQGHDVAVVGVFPSKTVVGAGCPMNITVKIKDYGTYDETFNVTVYANKIPIGIGQISLVSGATAALTFTWNTTGLAKGNYTISAYAWPVQNETDVTDNRLIGGWVIIAMVGDLTGINGWPDGKVDMRDIAKVAKVFGITQHDPRYEPNCDIYYDGKIDMRDVAAVARNFGKIDP